MSDTLNNLRQDGTLMLIGVFVIITVLRLGFMCFRSISEAKKSRANSNTKRVSDEKIVLEEALTERLGTWTGEDFLDDEGNSVPSRAKEDHEFIRWMHHHGQLTDIELDTSEKEYGPDLWGELSVLNIGDEVWAFSQYTWRGRVLVRDGKILDSRWDTHFYYGPGKGMGTVGNGSSPFVRIGSGEREISK